MSSFKAQSRLLGLPDGSSDDDDSGEDAAVPEEVEDQHDDGSDSDDESDAADVAAETSTAGSSKAKELRNARKRESAWLASNFISMSKGTNGASVYKSDLLPDKVFFSKEKVEEFVSGRRYKRLIHEMRKGMRTHAENEKLRLKASARRERAHARRQEKKREKIEKRRALPTDADEIERRKALFQAKKARRMERKAAAAESAS